MYDRKLLSEILVVDVDPNTTPVFLSYLYGSFACFIFSLRVIPRAYIIEHSYPENVKHIARERHKQIEEQYVNVEDGLSPGVFCDSGTVDVCDVGRGCHT